MRCLSSSEFRRWAIVERVEGFGEYARALQTGLQLSLLANINRKEGTAAYSAEDFMPVTMRTRRESPSQTPEQMQQIMFLLKAHQDAFLERQAAERRQLEETAGANGTSDTGT